MNGLRRLMYGYKIFLAALAGVSFASAITLVLFLPPRPVVGAWVAEFTFWGLVLAIFLILRMSKPDLAWFVALRWAAWVGITMTMVLGFAVGRSLSWTILAAWVVVILLFEVSMSVGKSSGRKKKR